jgi:hypothetical protein
MKAFTTLTLLAFASPALAAETGASPECVIMPDGVPDSPEEAMQMAQKGVEYVKAKNWWGLSAIAIFIAMFVMKAAGLFKKIGKRWAYIVVPSLSLIAMVLAKFAGGLSWAAAAAVLTSGPAMAVLNDFVKRGVMGKEPTTPVKKVKNG